MFIKKGGERKTEDSVRRTSFKRTINGNEGTRKDITLLMLIYIRVMGEGVREEEVLSLVYYQPTPNFHTMIWDAAKAHCLWLLVIG